MARGVYTFKNPNLRKNEPYKVIKERFVVVCSKCKEPSKGWIQAALNKGEFMVVTTTFDGFCGNKKCEAKIVEQIVMRLENR